MRRQRLRHAFFYTSYIASLLIVLNIFEQPTIFAQTANISKLFKKAMKEKNSLLRFNKLNEIIDLDPSHCEALYELGLIYKQQKNYRRAQNYFILARNNFDDDLKDDKKVEILYDLAYAYEKNGKFQLYEQTLYEVQALPITDEFRSQLDFELGRLYFKQSRYEKALAILTRSKGLVEEDTNNYLNLIEIIKLTQDLEQKYAQAEQERSNGNLKVAFDLFMEINNRTPGFKNVTKKLKSLQAALARAGKNIDGARDNTTSVSDYMTDQPRAALSARQDKMRFAAKSPEIKRTTDSTHSRMSSLDNALDSGVGPGDSLSETSYEDNNSINTDILTQSFRIDIDSLFKRAYASYQNQNWLDATIDFEVLQNLHRDYKGSDSLLNHARAELHKENTAQIPTTPTQSPLSYFFLGISAIIVLPILGLIVSPDMRAQYFLVRKDYYAAAAIYEKIISRNPTRKKIYPKLAHIYLLSGRVDKSAIHVYKRALQLSINTNQRDKIASLVMQKYLQDGQSDNDAIEVLEKVLRQETVRKQVN